MNNRPFAVFDIDGTLVRWQLYHAIVAQLAAENKLSETASRAITTSLTTWRERSHDESFRSYEQTIIDGYHSALKDLAVADFKRIASDVFDSHKDQVYTYTRDLIRTLKADGYLLFAISGSHQEVVEKIGSYYGFDEVIGAHYIRVDGRFTGARISPADSGKGALVRDLAARWNATWQGSLAIGDSMIDVEALALVERPIAFNPNRQLFDEAKKHGWDIVVERKNMVYHLHKKATDYKLLSS